LRAISDSAVRILSLIAFGGLAWSVLGLWIEGGSERFYLLVPPFGLAVFIRLSAAGWSRLKARAVPACGCMAGLVLVSGAYEASVTWDCSAAVGGGLCAVNLPEILAAGYFVLSVLVLIAGSYWLLNRAFGKLHDSLFGGAVLGGNPGNRREGRARERTLGLTLRKGLPLVLTVVLCVPYLIGAFYVHRFKIPNTSTPLEIAGRPFEDVEFVTADSFTIRGWFIPAEQRSRQTLLICHGLGANRSLFLPYLKVGNALGSNVLMFDFRGHGESDGHTISLGSKEKLDVLAALAYLRHDRPEQAEEVIGLGISMGAAALVGAAADVQPPFDAIILDSGFASAVELTDKLLTIIPDVFRPYLTGMGIPLACLETGCWLPEIRPEDEVARLRAPVLIIHAEEDPLIPVDHAVRLYDHAIETKTLWVAHTQGHGSALFQAEENYLDTITGWYTTQSSQKAAAVSYSGPPGQLAGNARRFGHQVGDRPR
jgi:alpha-beta hydrolase superfamily lysophospholipase